jgi:hypothetical protein
MRKIRVFVVAAALIGFGVWVFAVAAAVIATGVGV